MKNIIEDLEHDGMICAFDHRRFYNADLIFSPKKLELASHNYEYSRVRISNDEGQFDLNTRQKEWRRINTYYSISADDLLVIYNFHDLLDEINQLLTID